MNSDAFGYYTRYLKEDVNASIVVFLVALPLCLGVALASGAPLFSGVIAGIIGGMVVAWASGSQLSVSGPAAGLTVVVLMAIEQLGGFSVFLLSVVLAGIMQVVMGYLRAGSIGAFFPSSVIKAMLAAIGLILIIKQIPHALGYDGSFEGDESYMLETARSSFEDIATAFGSISITATTIALVSLAIMIMWEFGWMKKITFVRLVPSALVVVMFSIAANIFATQYFPLYALDATHLVALPVIENFDAFKALFVFPDLSAWNNIDVYKVAVTIAIIGSLETLLSLEAVDKLDPLKRVAPTNRELKAQGLGNVLSGMIGGLPLTAVIVRSSVNINAGGKTKVASFLHGVLLLLSVLFLAQFLNYIPLSALAAILLYTGYKLANPKIFKELYKQGYNQFLPFIITVVAILTTDLLQGMLIGVVTGLFFVIRSNYHASIKLEREDGHYVVRLNRDVSFLNKALLRSYFAKIEDGSTLIVDGRKAEFVDDDIMETIEDFMLSAPDRDIKMEILFYGDPKVEHHERDDSLNLYQLAKNA